MNKKLEQGKFLFRTQILEQDLSVEQKKTEAKSKHISLVNSQNYNGLN